MLFIDSGRIKETHIKEISLNTSTAFSTSHEKHFIDKIGTFGEMPRDKSTLLRGYIIGMGKRTDFGNIDKKECLKYAHKQLNKLTGLIG